MSRNAGQVRPRRGWRRLILVMVTGALLVSGMMRLGTGMGAALTEAGYPESTPPSSTAAAPQTDTAQLLAALQEREARLDAREAALADRFAALDIAQAQIAGQMAALTEAESRLAATLALADAAAETDVARLTAVYENMRLQEAAALFSEMDPGFAAGFLARMQPEIAAAVLSGMPPRAAYTISVILAGRHVGVPTE